MSPTCYIISNSAVTPRPQTLNPHLPAGTVGVFPVKLCWVALMLWFAAGSHCDPLGPRGARSGPVLMVSQWVVVLFVLFATSLPAAILSILAIFRSSLVVLGNCLSMVSHLLCRRIFRA